MIQEAHRRYKDDLFEQFARVTKALGNARRLEIIDLLSQGERTVERLARDLGQSIANTSQHLQTLKSARLVEVRREGSYGFYRLSGDDVIEVWRAVRAVGQRRLADIEQVVEMYTTRRSGMESIGAKELLERMEREDVTVLDVRPPIEYDAGHIAGALSIPIEELAHRLAELPDDRAIVAYCRGPYCVFADEAVALLRHHGVEAVRLREGFPDWRVAGHPTA